MKVLIIEDSDSKFAAVRDVVEPFLKGGQITRASTMIDAEREVAKLGWDLVVLDISMDIAPSALGPRSRGQANIGGLGIAQRMFLLDQEAPTIIVTAFDSFSAPTVGGGGAEILGFEEVKKRAEQVLPSSLLACLQYNSEGWKDQMATVIYEALAI